MSDQTYIYCWGNNNDPIGRERLKYKGRQCHVLRRGGMNSCLIEFLDNNERLSCSRNAIRKAAKMCKQMCEHKKTILATADYVEFVPDDEPFKAGVSEYSGYSVITVTTLNIHWCPECRKIVSFSADGLRTG